MKELEQYLKDHYFQGENNIIVIEPKPTLSKIVKDGLQAIDDAVARVIARHEKEIEAEKPKVRHDLRYDYRELGSAYVDSMRFSQAYQMAGCRSPLSGIQGMVRQAQSNPFYGAAGMAAANIFGGR